MPYRTILHLCLVAVVGIVVCQSGCDRAEAAKRKKAAENLKQLGDALAAHELALDSASSDPPTNQLKEDRADSLSPTDTRQSKGVSIPLPPMPDQEASDTDTADDYDPEAEAAAEAARKKKLAEPTIEITDNWTRLSKDREIWIDKKAKQVMFAGRICLTAGQLEMFICPEGTKEHESVISSSALASEVHMSLLLIGSKPGKASAWDPVYRPAHGPTIDATIKWRDEESGKTKSTDAKQWIRNVDTNKAMAQRWIFGGSEFWKDPDTGEEVYYGDSGELICLSNFSTATIDVDVKSSQANDGLLFEAFTENIPPVGTKVYTILTPGEIVKPEVVKPKAKPEESVEASVDKTEAKKEPAE